MFRLEALTPIEEAGRQLQVCNSCRYCEGLCPVFPALERRSFLSEGDVVFLANLCHDCRACLHACPYSPPHEFGIDLPIALSTVRREAYGQFVRPQAFGALYRHPVPSSILAAAIATALIALAEWILNPAALFATYDGPGSFYRVIPWLWMVLPALGAGLWAALAMLKGARVFLEAMDAPPHVARPRSIIAAVVDVVALRHWRGGGAGCPYPDDRPNHLRAVSHQLVFLGFVATFVSTLVAALYQDVLGILPPYPALSPPVLIGTAGGVSVVIGGVSLLVMKAKTDRHLQPTGMLRLDVAFLWSLIGTSLTGLLLLAVRETPLMGTLLVIHLGFVAGLLATLPYGKFVHGIYRSAALVRNRMEDERPIQ